MDQATLDNFLKHYRQMTPEDLSALDQRREELVPEAIAALEIVLKDAATQEQVAKVAPHIAKIIAPKPLTRGIWLNLLIFCLFAYGPVTIISSYLFFIQSEPDFPTLTSRSDWQLFKLVYWAVIGVQTLFSLYAAAKLCRSRQPRGVQTRTVRAGTIRNVVLSLWLGGPIVTLLWPALLKLTLGSATMVTSLTGGTWFYEMAKSLFLATLWTLYLLKSKRVKALYAATHNEAGHSL